MLWYNKLCNIYTDTVKRLFIKTRRTYGSSKLRESSQGADHCFRKHLSHQKEKKKKKGLIIFLVVLLVVSCRRLQAVTLWNARSLSPHSQTILGACAYYEF